MNLSTKNKHQLDYSLLWLFLGVGIPTTISAIIEFFKAKGHMIRLKSLIKSIILAVLGSFTGIITYRIIYEIALQFLG